MIQLGLFKKKIVPQQQQISEIDFDKIETIEDVRVFLKALCPKGIYTDQIQYYGLKKYIKK